MISLSIFSNWAVGVINGYKQKDNGLPNEIKYGTMGITSLMMTLKVMAEWNTSTTMKNLKSGHKLAACVVGVPFYMATSFCTGHHLGKAIRWTDDDSNSRSVIH